MKKIVILRIPNAKNNGSAMMAINTISFFDFYFDRKVEFLCDFSTDDDKSRIINELTPGISVSRLEFPEFRRGPNIVTSFCNRLVWINDILRVIEEVQPLSIIVLGGDDFSEYYSGYKIIVRLYFMYRLSLCFPLYLIGHTIGPFKSWRKPAFKFLMSRSRIVTRDFLSLQHCQKDLGHNRSSLGHDLAWLDLPKHTAELTEKLLTKYGLEEDQFIVVVPSALLRLYGVDEETYFSSMVKLLERLLALGYQVVLLPHVFSDSKRDDRWAIDNIKKKAPRLTGVLYIADMLLPSECRALLAACHFSISCRMHGAVSTLQTGKPSIALSYSIKYAGVIGEDMQLSELLIEVTNGSVWEKYLVDNVVRKVKFIEENYDQLTRKILARVSVLKNEQNNVLDSCAVNMLENGGKPFGK